MECLNLCGLYKAGLIIKGDEGYRAIRKKAYTINGISL
jgi:hypothetical protein